MKIIRLLTAIRNKGYSVRACIVGLVASILLPTIIITGWLTWRSANSERALLERNSETKGREVLLDIEHEVVSSHAMLTALASSQFLQTDNFEAFHRQCSEVAKLLGAQIVLTDVKTGEQLLNSAIPFGQPLPRIPTPALDARTETIRTGTARISNVFFAPVLKRFFVSVGLPVMRSGNVAYYLAVGIPVDTFADALKNAALPDQWTVTLIDRDNTIVARSEKHREVAGTKLRVDLAARGSGIEGASTGSDRYGVFYHWTWHRSALTGWFVAIGVPLSILEAPAKNALTNFAIAGGALFAIAIALSFYLGGHLSQSVGEMGIDRQPTRDEFRLLFDTAPNGVLVVDNRGIIALVNAVIEAQFGYSREELIGRSFEILIPQRFRDGHTKLQAAFQRDPQARPMGAGRELYGRRKDGSEFPVEIGLNPIRTGARKFVMATVVDITDRKHAEERIRAASDALHTSEEQRHLAVEAAEIATWTWDFVTDGLSWSDRMREIIGVPSTLVPSHKNYFDRIHPLDRHIAEENTERARSGLRNFESEYRIVRLNDQALRWVNSKGRFSCDASGKPLGMHGVIQDITTRKDAERDHHELRRRLMNAQEQERLRLAQELHDQTGQSLTAVMLQLKSIEKRIGEGGRNELQQLRLQLEQMGKTLHRVAWELRPASIDELGLTSALTNYIADWSVQTDIEADFYGKAANVEDLPEDVQSTIYRVVQEALTNVAKHAATATTVSVLVDRGADILRLAITDNGCGFDPIGVNAGRLGLSGMRERLAVIGGILEIESFVGIGTTVFARIPIASERLSA